jgi:hypothetical protein
MSRLQAQRRSVLAEVQAAGTWTPRQLSAYARGQADGSEPVYEALHYWVRKGRITYTPNLWTAA